MIRLRLDWLLVGLCAVVLTACVPQLATSPWSTTAPLTPDLLIRSGDAAAQRLIQEHGGRFVDETVQTYLNTLVDRVSQSCAFDDISWRLIVVNDDACDLIAVPGGTLLVYRGLLERINDETQLAALLSHAMAHLKAGHEVQGALNADVLRGKVDPLPGADDAGVRGQPLADFLVNQIYTPGEESAAHQLFFERDVTRIAPGAACGWSARHPGKPLGVTRPGGWALEDDAVRFADMHAVVVHLAAGYDVFEQAQQLERQDKLPQAISLYLQAATQASDQGLILTGIGLAYLQVGEVNSAYHYLQRAVRLDGHYYRSRLGLGYVFSQQGKLSEAEEQLNRSRTLLPTLQGHYLLADLYARQDNWSDAEVLYRQVMAADPQGTLGKAARRALKDRAAQ